MADQTNMTFEDAQQTAQYLRDIKAYVEEMSSKIDEHDKNSRTQIEQGLEEIDRRSQEKSVKIVQVAYAEIQRIRNEANFILNSLRFDLKRQMLLAMQETIQQMLTQEVAEKIPNVSPLTITGKTSYFFDTPTRISSDGQPCYVASDFILWEKCTIMLWVHVSPKGKGLRKDGSNSYLFSHYTQKKDAYNFHNQFCLRYNATEQEWQVIISNTNAEYPRPHKRLTIADNLGNYNGWHHFLLSWNKSEQKLVFAIDSGKGRHLSEKVNDSEFFHCWPEQTTDHVTIGAWPELNKKDHYCDTELFNMFVMNDYLPMQA